MKPNSPQFSLQQIQAAWQKVQQGSAVAGIDGITIELFRGIAPEELKLLQKQLQQEHYLASPARGFYCPKGSGGQRLIGIPTIRDRIVQRHLLQGMYPRLEQQLSSACHAYRPGYSIHTAVAEVMTTYEPGCWVVKVDIRQFFDHLVWALLLGQLEQAKFHPTLIQLIEQSLKAGVVVQGRSLPLNQGVMQGSVLSGALANLYLSEFDRTCLESGIHLVRYGDDCLAVCHSWMQAERALSLITDRLAEIYLTAHPEKTKILAPSESFVFLGHRFEQGQVYAPERAAVRPSKPKSTSAPVGRPRVCSIRQSEAPLSIRESHPDRYWREPMTTLYITDQGAYLRLKQEQFQVLLKQNLKIAVPINRVSHVVLFGCCNLSHGAVSLALRRRIPILYLSSKGQYFGRLDTAGYAQVEYLTKQVQSSLNSEFIVRQAQSVILGKLHNSRILLMRLHRKRPSELAEKAISRLPDMMEQVRAASSVESMLGYEGQGAHLYFQAYATLLKGRFEFEKRTRKPPTDPVNSLLSLGYTLLTQQLHSMVEVAGLHPHFGNLHKPQKQRPSLVCDLVEEFRALVVDGLVAYLVNSNIFVEEDFTPPDGRGGVYLHPDGLKKFLKHWEEKLQQTVTHPHTGYKVSYQRCFELQVWEYVQVLLGERETYRPMLWDR